MEAMQDEDIGPAPADSVSAEDLQRTLGYDRAQRNPLLVRMRRRFPARMADLGDDETGFYQAFLDLAEDPATRDELAGVLNELLRGRNGKWQFAYSLLLRLSKRCDERLKTLPADGKAILNEIDLYRDALTLDRLAAHGEAVWVRVYRWAIRLGLDSLPSGDLPLAAAVRRLLLHGAGTDANHGKAGALDEAAEIGDPLATWQETRAGLMGAFATLDERPDVEAAFELMKMSVRLWKAASVWTDTGRLDAARARLDALLEAAAPLASEPVERVRGALTMCLWTATDAEQLEAIGERLDAPVHAAVEAQADCAAAVAAVDAAHAGQRYGELGTLGPQAADAKRCADSARAMLNVALQAVTDELTARTAVDAPAAAETSGNAAEELAADPGPARSGSMPEPVLAVEAAATATESRPATTGAVPASSGTHLLRAAGHGVLQPAPDVVPDTHAPAWSLPRPEAVLPLATPPVPSHVPLDHALLAHDLAADTAMAPLVDSGTADAGDADEPATSGPELAPTFPGAAATIAPESAPVPVAARGLGADEYLPEVAEYPAADASIESKASDAAGTPASSVVDPLAAAAAIWQAVADDRCGLAWQLAQAVPAASAVPPALFAALALAPCVRSADDEASDWLGQQVALLSAAGNDHQDAMYGEAADLLRFAVAARPMLLSPYLTDAQQLLLDAPALESLDGFRELRRTLLDTSALGVSLTPVLLRGGFAHAQWNAEVQALRAAAADWLHEAPIRNTNFHRATLAWQRWSDAGGEIGRVIAPLAQEGRWPIEALSAFRERLRDVDTLLERLLLDTDPRQAKAPIEGRARKRLHEYLDEVRVLLDRALELHAARPKDQDRMQAVDVLRRSLRVQIDTAQRSLDAWPARVGGDNGGTLPAAAVRRCVQRTLADLRALLGDDDGGANAVVTPWTALYGDLLLAADIVFADDWRPATAADPATLIDLSGQAPDIAAALERRCERGDLRAARRLLDLPPRPVGNAAALEERLATLGEVHRRKARNRRENLCTRLELMLQQGVLGEQQYADSVQVLEHYIDSPTGDLRFWQQRFAAIETGIDQALDRRRETLGKRLAVLDVPQLRARIERLLADDDLLTAHEYLDHCERGEPLPQAREDRPGLEEFFPLLVHAEARAAQRPQREDVLARRPLGRVRLDELPDERLDSSAELIDVWRELESGRRRAPGRQAPTYDPARPKSLLTRLFTALDFVDVEIHPRTEAGTGAATTYYLRCRPLSDRAFCPVPQYGSQAGGQYVLRCLEGGPEAGVDALLAQIRDLRGAAFALVLGWLDADMRRELAQVCRSHRQTVLVIDEALIQALAGVAGDRRRALFEWTLPFTWLNPFSITASRVPPELFHGRQRALEQVRNLREGFLVYGGRQLGKTALLTMTEHDCHRPTEERLALRIDLKSEGIGYGQGPGEIWEVIARLLNGLKLGILDERIVQQTVSDGGKALRQRLQQWLDAKPHRQLLLMLDEADAFMLKDADAEHPFTVLGSLKLLMEASGHRFKVVLAGLRDVQRMARIANVPNSPLAHLGRGICVGPLLADGESLAARRLLEAPLRALGFRFDSGELPNRILALANYYPSLIQVFGYHLIEHMTQRGGMLAGPPYRIGSQHIDDTFRQASLRDEFVKRFRMTVALDPRYHLIALLIAQQEIDLRQAGAPDSAGVDTAWVRRQALQWWPQGFAHQDSFDDFCTLLGEMVGLGVLRMVSGSISTQPGYVLRSPGIVQMLGGSENILHALDAIAESEPPQLYDADVFHPYLVNETGPRSPLTGRQEERLSALRREAGQPVLALLGTALAATPSHLHKLVARHDRHYRTAPESIDSADELCQWLLSDESGRSPASSGSDGFPLAVVPAAVPWTPDWLAATRACLQRHRLRTHLLFVGDEAAAWRWVTCVRGEHTDLLCLLPWTPRAIRQWLQDCSHELDAQDFACLLRFSGGWGRLLEGFGERINRSRNRSHVEKALAALADDPLTKGLEWPDPVIPETLDVLLGLADPAGLVSGVSAELIADELDPARRSQVEAALRWAEQLGLLERVSGSGSQPGWRLNSVVARLRGRQE